MSYITIRQDVDVDDILEDMDDEELQEELDSRKRRKGICPKSEYKINAPCEFRRQMCDMLDCGYYVSDADLVKALLDKIH